MKKKDLLRRIEELELRVAQIEAKPPVFAPLHPPVVTYEKVFPVPLRPSSGGNPLLY